MDQYGWVDDYDPDPDPEEDRYSVWDRGREEYVSVFDVPRLMRWRRFVTYDWQYKVAGPFYRFRHNVRRHFMLCKNCGRLGCGPYWFSETCSYDCSHAVYAQSVEDRPKLHMCSGRRGRENYTYCGYFLPFHGKDLQTGIWSQAMQGKYDDKFCSTCLAAVKREYTWWSLLLRKLR